jgi:hypothetical protein
LIYFLSPKIAKPFTRPMRYRAIIFRYFSGKIGNFLRENRQSFRKNQQSFRGERQSFREDQQSFREERLSFREKSAIFPEKLTVFPEKLAVSTGKRAISAQYFRTLNGHLGIMRVRLKNHFRTPCDGLGMDGFFGIQKSFCYTSCLPAAWCLYPVKRRQIVTFSA